MQELDNGLFVGIVDPAKVYDIVGQERIESWISTIEKDGDIKEFVSKCSRRPVTIEDYCCRTLWCPQGLKPKPNEELRELIHNGFGHAYIPGSSIKGAIRTALLSHFIKKNHIGIDQRIKKWNERKRIDEYKATSMETTVFGPDPNSDCMRFIQVGDALFDYSCEDVLKISNLNIRGGGRFLDASKSQFVEVITIDEESQPFSMNVGSLIQDKDLDKYNKFTNEWNLRESKHKNPIKKLDVDGIHALTSIINQHTLELLNGEKDIWEEYTSADGVDQYLKAIDAILKKVKSCAENECILRIGHASGWRFTTGAWTEDVENDDIWNGIVNASRPNNNNYNGFIFPKSRRINYDSKEGVTLLGFVKLTILD